MNCRLSTSNVPDGMSMDGKTVDFLRAEHGFSALIESRRP